LRCPKCSSLEDRVVDSRTSKDGSLIRRRRECISCKWRFTTYERIEESTPLIIKKSGGREPFDRHKMLSGILKACEKRPISYETIVEVANRIEAEVFSLGEKEIPSTVIGEKVMEELRGLDDVAYVRFASVYRSFKDLSQFMDEIKSIYELPPAKKRDPENG
jgi:transcriptional repressor NrdR